VLDYHLLKSLKLRGQVVGEEQVALVLAEQVVLAGAVQVAAGESSKELNGVVAGVADVKRPGGRSATFELFAAALQHFTEVVTKLTQTSTALAAPAAACS